MLLTLWSQAILEHSFFNPLSLSLIVPLTQKAVSSLLRYHFAEMHFVVTPVSMKSTPFALLPGTHDINCLVCYWSGHLKTMHQDVGFVPVLGAESSYCVLRLDWWGHQPG